ncbi:MULTISPECIES: hypothetical protein [Pseudoalteromonas]|uniref:hypothetical protein n=1 Tax=Pseudoalteromonas TaxID=53246 RepID=UPI00026CDAA0|nr:hypothetical protein [Pseudoalteromonas spongiae]ATC97621.1 hypothetical protein PSPO_a0398 [Pseudoalteromonas spongiae UST010723-006]
MNIGAVIKSEAIKKRLVKSIGYYAGSIAPLSDQVDLNSFKPKLVIVSNKYCDVKTITYPAIGKKELLDILKLDRESSAHAVTHVVMKNSEQEGFDVRRTEIRVIDSEVQNSALCLIPESEILANADTKGLFNLATPVGEMFFLNVDRPFYSYKTRLMSTPELFCLSVGVNNEDVQTNIAGCDYLKFIFDTLLTIPFDKLVKVCHFEVKKHIPLTQLHSLYIAPLAAVTLLYSVIYGYTLFKVDQLEQHVKSYGDDVSSLLNRKAVIDFNSEFIDVVNKRIVSAPLVHSDWNLVHEAINAGMDLQQFSKRDGIVTLRGMSDNASNVLKHVSSLEYVESAEFFGTVRKSRQRDYSVIHVRLKS